MPLALRDYQAEDVLVHRRRGKLMNLGEVGTGKTVVASRAVYEPGVFDARPCLIACPNHVVPDWEGHLISEYPDDRIVVAAELSPDDKREALSGGFDWLIVNHAMLAIPSPRKDKKREKKGLAPSPRTYYKMPRVKSFVLDESHANGLGRTSNAWLGARVLADGVKGGLVIPMTGTPIKKTADGLWAQLRLVDRTLTSYWRFVNQHCEVRETPWVVEIVGSKPSAAIELAKRSIRRTYAEVGLELPDVIPYETKVKLTTKTRQAYDRLKEELRDEENNPVFSAGAAVAKLRSLTSRDPNKVGKLKECLEDLDQYVVFVKYHETAHRLAEELGATWITGEIPGARRNQIAKASKKIIAGIESLAASVDLSHHRDVFMYEEVYEPGIMANALGRVARWRKGGGDAPVRLRYIYCERTLDQRIHNLVAGRALDAENVTDRRLIQEELH